MVEPPTLDEEIDSLADWADLAAAALMRFYEDAQGVFQHAVPAYEKPVRGKGAHATSTLRSFFALAEYLRFLYEEGRQDDKQPGLCRRPRKTPKGVPQQGQDKPPCERARQVLSGVVEKYLGQLPTDPSYVRASSANGINMFTDGHLLLAVSLLPRLRDALKLDAKKVIEINTAAAAVAEKNEELLRRWQGGNLQNEEEEQVDDFVTLRAARAVHHFVTLHAVRGVDAYRLSDRGLDDKLVEGLRERVKRDVLELLAFHSAGVSSRFDASELAFGLALLGRFPTPDTARLSQRAIQAIVAAQAPDGAWPPARFVSFAAYRGEQGVLHVTSYEVALTLAQLLIRYLHEGDEPSAEAILPALAPAFQLVQSYYTSEGGFDGWANDHTRLPWFLESWATAIVLTFLIHYRDALIEMRQRRILRKYETRYPRKAFWVQTWPDLTPLFRGAEPIDATPLDCIHDPTSDGGLVPRLKAVTVGRVEKSCVRRPAGGSSVILYGPPGTGKTGAAAQIAEALQWPLLTIWPPQFLCKSGLEGFEASAVEIFDDLQRLRRVVVLLDECEDFFRRREPMQQLASRTIGAFITAGMLPRLLRLREERWVVFVLATNSELWELDEAVRRPGRFDLVEELGHPTLEAQLRYVGKEPRLTPDVAHVVRKVLEHHEQARRKRDGRLDLSFSDLDKLVTDVLSAEQPPRLETASRRLEELLNEKRPAAAGTDQGV